MPYDDRLYDGSDPLYAPGLNASGDRFYWKSPKKYLTAGWALKSVKLEGDAETRALKCRELTIEMLAWFDSRIMKVDHGTWRWLFSRYKGDKFSPIQEVKGNTREQYLVNIGRWEAEIGDEDLKNSTYEVIKSWQIGMRDKGRTASYIKRQFGMLRIVAGYGSAIGNADSARISSILSNMQFKNSGKRAQVATRTHVTAVIAAADAAGDASFATGLMMQFEFALRAVDVRGQWLDGKPEDGGIIRGGKRWQDGLTWDMIDRDVTTITKIISKTSDSTDMAAMRFDLGNVPELRARLLAVPLMSRIGPVIKSRTGKPFHKRTWAAMWRRHAEAAGVPFEIQMRDTRAGAITEARANGANIIAIRDMAGHSTSEMTQRYLRSRSEAANEVILLRQRGTNIRLAHNN